MDQYSTCNGVMGLPCLLACLPSCVLACFLACFLACLLACLHADQRGTSDKLHGARVRKVQPRHWQQEFATISRTCSGQQGASAGKDERAPFQDPKQQGHSHLSNGQYYLLEAHQVVSPFGKVEIVGFHLSSQKHPRPLAWARTGMHHNASSTSQKHVPLK